MRHARQPDELLEVFGDELRPVVGDDPWPGFRELLLGPLQDDFHIRFGHLLPDLPMDDVPAAAIQETAQVVESTAQVDVGDIHMPVLMRLQRLNEAGALEGLFAVPLPQQSFLAENAVGAGRADGDDVLVKHHKRQPAISFKRVVVVELDDLLALPVFEPEISWDRGVVLVGFSIPLDPAVKLALGNRQPEDEPVQSYFSLLRPLLGEVNDSVACVMGNPLAGQSSPSSFFSLICSSISSESTSCLRCSFASSCWIRVASALFWLLWVRLNAAAPFSKKSFCHW